MDVRNVPVKQESNPYVLVTDGSSYFGKQRANDILSYAELCKKVHVGRSLGTSFTSAQKTQIANGTFIGMDIGDYWDIGGIRWRIWDIDWYLNKGDSQTTKHHLVIMPDSNLLNADGSSTHYMRDSNDTSGGYKATNYFTTHRATCLQKVKDCFGNYVLTHRRLISNAMSNGEASGWEWADCTVEIPSEIMMYGSNVWGNGKYNVGTAYPQLALARFDPSRVINRASYWLSDIGSASWFASVDRSGNANCDVASRAGVGVRPYFLLCGN